MTFDDLYRHLLLQAAAGNPLSPPPGADPAQLDCLFHPERHPPVLTPGRCACGEGERPCAAACLFQAVVRGPDGQVAIDPERCCGCGACLEACRSGALTASRDVLPALAAVKEARGPVYALIAPAFLGQFSPAVTPGRLRTAFRALGFTGMVEVALFADLLTLKEALEFHRHVRTDGDFQLTSCCCPVWIAMVRRVYRQLMPHVPGAVSPMVAAGRAVKALHPDALTIFVGPCLAKKSEAREPDLAGAVDFVLTFQEVRDIFRAADLRPEELEETDRDHSSRCGRLYARAGGVSEAVQATVERLCPDRAIPVRARRADGVPACRAMLEELLAGRGGANFFEGMGCPGGCVGGPKAVLPADQGTRNVDRYGAASPYATPLDNPYVLQVLRRLGFDTVEDFLTRGELFNRRFSDPPGEG